ncbi:hypothetical protein N9L91_01500 [Pseudomonadales bacterium]|nr:hypothetical protein [Pseudomonadales bacterium]
MNKLVKSLGDYSTRILLTFCLLSTFATASSWASVVSLQSGEIQDMVAVDQGAPAFSFKTDHTDDGAVFLTFWLYIENGYRVGSIATPVSWNADWSDHSLFQQRIINRDESPWTFSMSIDDGANIYTSNVLALAGVSGDEISPNVTEGTLLFDFSSLEFESVDLSNISSVSLNISGVLPVDNYDRVAEYELAFEVGDVNPVPIPSSMLLFASSLMLLSLRKKIIKSFK